MKSKDLVRREPARLRWVLVDHLPEYLMEAVALAAFMMSACLFATLLFHPASIAEALHVNPLLRRCLMGLAMGSTAISIVYSPWGMQSGAHFNPALTLTYWRLGKVSSTDAMAYVVAHFVGALLGIGLAILVMGSWIADPHVLYVATRPGSAGTGAAVITEGLISFVLMLTVLVVSNSRWARWTGIAAGSLVAMNIVLASPISGTSMNPARSFASAIPAGTWASLWIYFLAPPTGMLLAAELYVRLLGREHVHCAKMNHDHSKRCIFCQARGL
jgi:aquaporin Z